MEKYALVVKNNSTVAGDICVYQASPDLADSNVMSLAWLTQRVHPTTAVKFEWSPDYCFIWEEDGAPASGITLKASQVWSADLAGKNSVNLTYQNDAFTFANLGAGQENCLQIHQDSTIPLKTAMVGIGMSGAGTFVVQSQPNMELMFTPHPAYWVAFGNYEQGQVLDTTQITNAVRVDFPPNVFTMDVALNPDNTWTVTPAQS